jgi:hypothetical protein
MATIANIGWLPDRFPSTAPTQKSLHQPTYAHDTDLTRTKPSN